MADHRDEMMEWVLGELAGPEGESIFRHPVMRGSSEKRGALHCIGKGIGGGSGLYKGFARRFGHLR
jgi:hypothetical protein